jgi:16S rRNA (uracil1498-N3)-methyltransferase
MFNSSLVFYSNTPDGVNLFYQSQITNGVHSLDEEESRHCIKVLRKKTGDVIRVTDGQGNFYSATITDVALPLCRFRIDSTEREGAKSWSVHIAVSPTKNADRIEWFVEKAVELGVDEITLLNCEHTERAYLKTERLMKVAVAAMKQSLKATLPRINPLTDFNAIVNQSEGLAKFIAFVDPQNNAHLKDTGTNQKYLVLIGPEGDFSSAELELATKNGFQKISLGSSRLRTETAALAACHILNLING